MDEQIYNEFISKQNSIYQKFIDAQEKILVEGLNKHQLSSKGVYMLYFVHPLEISQRVEELSKNISTIVPAIIYSAPNVHTTISDYDGPKVNFEPNEDILKKLSMSVNSASKLIQPKIVYDGLLTNQDTVIIRGNPDSNFLETASSVINNAKTRGIELRMPWGSHITTARLNDKIMDNTQIKTLLDYVNSKDNGRFISEPTHIGVGYGLFSEDGSSFKVNTFDEYRFK
jgi:hypothetical protein